MNQIDPTDTEPTLKGRVITGIGFSTLAQVSRQAVSILTTTAVAWFVTPSDFGLVGMAMIATGLGQVFANIGTGSALIQRKNLSEELLSSIFWLNVALGVAVTGVLMLLAPMIALVFQEPRLLPIIQALAWVFALSGFGLTQQAMLERELAFDKLAKITLASALIGSVTGITAAARGCGAMSLVYQMLVMTGGEMLMLWKASQWLPRPCFHWKEVRSVLGYSINLSGYYLFEFLMKNADSLLIGRYLGAHALGYYSLAFRLGVVPLLNFSTMIGRVMFPVYAKIEEDAEAFRRIYLRAAGAMASIAFPFAIGMLALAKPLIHAVFGDNWHPTATLLMLLVPTAFIQCLIQTTYGIYQAKGRTDWLFGWGIATGGLTAVGFAVGLKWGTIGVAGAYAVVSLLILGYPGLAMPFTLIELDFSAFLKSLWPPLLSSTMMYSSIMVVRYLLPARIPELMSLGILLCCAFLTYLFFSWHFNRAPFEEIRAVMRRFAPKRAIDTQSIGG